MNFGEAVTAIVEALVGPRIVASRLYPFRVVTQHGDGTLDLDPADEAQETARLAVARAFEDLEIAKAAIETARAALAAATSEPAITNARNELTARESARSAAEYRLTNAERMLAAATAQRRDILPSLANVPLAYGEPGMRAKVRAGARVYVQFVAGDVTQPIVTAWAPGAAEELSFDASRVKLAGDIPIARKGDLVSCTITPLHMVQLGVATTGGKPVSVAGIIVSGSKTASAGA